MQAAVARELSLGFIPQPDDTGDVLAIALDKILKKKSWMKLNPIQLNIWLYLAVFNC